MESCLPEEVIRVCQRSEHYSIEDTLRERLDFLTKLLKKEVESEGQIALATSSFNIHKHNEHTSQRV